jgi:UDP-N-acetylmuramate dehydrogenase
MQIVREPNLSKRTTLRLGGQGMAELLLETARDFDRLQGELEREGGIPISWGQGSNILARDGDQPLVLVTPVLRGPRVEKSSEETVLVRSGAGVRMAGLLSWCAGQGLSGLEKLAGIPGNLGGAVGMNAGSFGVQMSDALSRVRVWTQADGLVWLNPEEWQTGYRSFSLPGRSGFYVIAEVELELAKAAPDMVRKTLRETYFRKKQAQPVATKTCGCVFKNPPGEKPAGWLLEQSGFKGKSNGGVSFSEMHANFLVHTGEGTSGQALELIEEARDSVRQNFGIELELEVKVVPCR